MLLKRRITYILKNLENQEQSKLKLFMNKKNQKQEQSVKVQSS